MTRAHYRDVSDARPFNALVHQAPETEFSDPCSNSCPDGNLALPWLDLAQRGDRNLSAQSCSRTFEVFAGSSRFARNLVVCKRTYLPAVLVPNDDLRPVLLREAWSQRVTD